MDIKNLQPEAVWHYFEEICHIPRPSFKEQKMIGYLEKFAEKQKLICRKDQAGNVVITKRASTGFENRKSVCLQSHLDMVTEKDSGSTHNFETDPIIPVMEGDWIKAKGTTLGADNGIGIAVQLAILADKEAQHGPLECLFTVAEEAGLEGAKKLAPGLFKSRILINLDSEDEGELFIGCAGGIDTIATLRFKTVQSDHALKAYMIRLTGLKGGHSGDDINKGRGNSIKILAAILNSLFKRYHADLSVFEGGNLINAIPREAYALIGVKSEERERFESEQVNTLKKVEEEWKKNEPGLKITSAGANVPKAFIDKTDVKKLFDAILRCPNGVTAMSKKVEGLVETSTNLASVKFTSENEITVSTSQRSSIDKSMRDLAGKVRDIFESIGAKVTQSEGYPGWEPDTHSEILDITKKAYVELFGKEPLVKAVHAGLECGVILKKYPGTDMISFGPTIRDVHSPAEKMEISSVGKFRDLLLRVLNKISIV